MDIAKNLIKQVKGLHGKIILPEAENSKLVMQAGLNMAKKGICEVVFLTTGKLDGFTAKNVSVVNMKTFDKLGEMAEALYQLRKHKGITLADAKKLLKTPMYFACMMLKLDMASGIVCGAVTSSKDVLKPALQIIKAREGITTVSSSFILTGKGVKSPLVMSDCGLVVDPTSEELCDIAKASAFTMRNIVGLEPRLAFLSYSSHSSGAGESVDKVKQAVKLFKSCKAGAVFDGELQADSALNKRVAEIKVPKSKIKGDANVLIMPSLDAGNIGYKLFQQASGCTAIGPITQGLAKPVNDLSRGANLKEIEIAILITLKQALNNN